MTPQPRRYFPFKYTLKVPTEPSVELAVQPCMRRYKWEADHVLNDYRLVQYKHIDLSSMLTIWEKKI